MPPNRAALAGLAVIVAAAGCAPRYIWIHPSADRAQFDRDKAQCEYEAATATQQTDYSYRTSFGQELDRAVRRGEIGALCMKAKGYSQRPIDAGN